MNLVAYQAVRIQIKYALFTDVVLTLHDLALAVKLVASFLTIR